MIITYQQSKCHKANCLTPRLPSRLTQPQQGQCRYPICIGASGGGHSWCVSLLVCNCHNAWWVLVRHSNLDCTGLYLDCVNRLKGNWLQPTTLGFTSEWWGWGEEEEWKKGMFVLLEFQVKAVGLFWSILHARWCDVSSCLLSEPNLLYP